MCRRTNGCSGPPPRYVSLAFAVDPSEPAALEPHLRTAQPGLGLGLETRLEIPKKKIRLPPRGTVRACASVLRARACPSRALFARGSARALGPTARRPRALRATPRRSRRRRRRTCSAARRRAAVPTTSKLRVSRKPLCPRNSQRSRPSLAQPPRAACDNLGTPATRPRHSPPWPIRDKTSALAGRQRASVFLETSSRRTLTHPMDSDPMSVAARSVASKVRKASWSAPHFAKNARRRRRGAPPDSRAAHLTTPALLREETYLILFFLLLTTPLKSNCELKCQSILK